MLPTRRAGSSKCSARCGDGSVEWGSAIAATNSSWNRGSVAVSILVTLRTAASISRAGARRDSARTAPAPAALPTDRDTVERTVGDQAEHHRVRPDRCGPRTRRRGGCRSIVRDARSARRAGRCPARSAALASWIARTSFWVIMRRVSLPTRTGRRRTCGRRARCGSVRSARVAEDRAVGVDDAGEEQLARSPRRCPTRTRPVTRRGGRRRTPARHSSARRRSRGTRGSSVARIDAHALDRAGGRSLPAADLRAFERRTGRARCGPDAVSAVPSTISALVPMSTRSCGCVGAVGPLARASRPRCPRPTCPAMHGRTYTGALRSRESESRGRRCDRVVGGRARTARSRAASDRFRARGGA